MIAEDDHSRAAQALSIGASRSPWITTPGWSPKGLARLAGAQAWSSATG